ncbi:T9SS type A sorting domain-containing protein [Xanthomarina gelatinilytica]|uniref:T9SS type A sorting domain-containing protein n=1 Tax=Xanthomarina gelatinilytica TaxID=1137281 RepID=UPI003AA85E94
MKYIYLLILFITNIFTFAQTDLYVRSGSYIYVDGTAFTSGPNVAPLYVTGRITFNGTNSNIYLRNEAQLLQGNNIGNNGRGKLSAYQTGTVNTYAYNYWCSPVGNTTANTTSNRPFIPNDNIYDHIGHTNPALDPITSVLATYTTGYNGVATAPPTPQVISSFWLYSYDPGVLYAEWDHVGETGSVTPGYGFTMKGNPSGGQPYDFRGKPNNGNITVNVVAGEETLVGNPYPSALDARDFIHDPLNSGLIANAPPQMTGVLKYWEQAPGATSHVLSNYVGGYALYTISSDGSLSSSIPAAFTTYLLDGTPTNTNMGIGSKTAYRYIPIGQGFMIEGAATGVVTFTNAQREFYKQSGTDSEFFRTADTSSTEDTIEEIEYTEDGLNIVPADYKRFRINVDFSENEFYTRQLLMNFHHTATDGFDYGLEAKTKFSENSDAYWILDDVPYLIQAFNYDMELRIPLVVEAKNNQPIRFRIFDVQNFDENQPIFIHDIHNDIYVDLRENNYEINLPQGTYTDRFEITFTSEALNIDQVITVEDLSIYQNNQLAQLTISNPKLLEVKQVNLYDVTGKQIFNEKNLNTESHYSFSTKNLSQGVYIAHVSFADNQVISKKIIVSNK